MSNELLIIKSIKELVTVKNQIQDFIESTADNKTLEVSYSSKVGEPVKTLSFNSNTDGEVIMYIKLAIEKYIENLEDELSSI